MTNPSTLIKAQNEERSKLIDLLCEARLHLVRASRVIDYAIEDADVGRPFLSTRLGAEAKADIDAFLAAGLFGDREPETKPEPVTGVAAVGAAYVASCGRHGR